MKKSCLVGLLLLSFSTFLEAQTVTSIQDGPWNDGNTWDSGIPPTSANSSSIVIEHSVSVPNSFSVTVDQVFININGNLTIDAGGIVTVADDGTGTSDFDMYNDGFDYGFLNVYGTLVANHGALITGADGNNCIFLSGSIYRHLYTTTEGSIPVASWDTNSTVEVQGYTGSITATAGGNWNQNFGNFTFNCSGLGAAVVQFSGLLTSIQNDLTVLSTGSGSLRFSNLENPTIVIGRDLIISGTSRVLFGSGTNTTINITRDFIFNSTNSSGTNFTTSGATTITVSRDFSMNASGGKLNFASSASGNGILNVIGNFNNNGTLNESSTSTFAGNINFIGAGTHIFNNSGTIANTINFSVNSTSTLDVGTSPLTGSGNFTLNGTLKIGSTDVNGALQLGSAAGNLRVTGTRTFASNSTIVYNGSGAQYIGNGHPTGSVNTQINNSNGVSIASGISTATINGSLTLTSGNLDASGKGLVLGGSINAGGNSIIVNSSTDLTIGGSSLTGTFPFASGAQTINNFTLNRSAGSVTFANDVTIGGIVTLTAGDLIYNGKILTLSGTFAGTGSGTLSGNSSSSLTIQGTGAFGILRISNTNPTVGTFTFNRSSGTASVDGTFIINTTCNLLSGDFTNTSGLQISNGAVLTRNSGAQLLGSVPTDLPAGQYYSVVYTGGALTTGVELPSTTDDQLGSLTINGGPVTLNQNIIVHNDLNLQSSTLQAGAFTITMSGVPGAWNKTGGSFNGGTGTVVIAGTISITASSTPSFVNITTNSGSSLTMPSGNLNLAGNLQLNAGGSFSANGGTIILNGSGDQIISAAGKTLNNMTVNKTGGNVTLMTSVNLTGLLNIQSATAVASNGNLTLISNASGTAAIGNLSGGGSITGNINSQRYFANAGRKYRDISSSVSGATVSQIIASGITITGSFTGTSYPCAGCSTNNPSMYYYDESVAGLQTLGYVAYPVSGSNSATSFMGVGSAGATAIGRGYNLFLRNELGSPTMTLTGTVISGSQTLPISYTSTSGGSTEDGWNFMGNPYPSAIDWDVVSGWSKSNIQGNQISVWDPNKGTSGGYRIWNGSVGDLGNGRIASGQGFWVKANSSPSLTINEAAKTTTATTFYREKSEQLHYLEVIVSGQGETDNLYIQKVEGASTGFDPADGLKLAFDEFNIATTLGETSQQLSIYAIGDLTEFMQVPLIVSNAVSGTYKLQLSSIGDFANVKVSIFDKKEGTYYELNNKTFEFTIEASGVSRIFDRYTLILGEKPSGVTGNSKYGLVVHPNPVEDIVHIMVDAQEEPFGEVLSVSGVSVGSLEWVRTDGGWVGKSDVTSLSGGVYIAKVMSDGNVRILKFVKK